MKPLETKNAYPALAAELREARLEESGEDA